jgi:GT2 family glycosyltransferase
MMNKPKVAVVIVHWNRKNLLEQFLPSVVNSSYPNLEVVIADNASTDDSLEYVRASFPSVKIVQNNQNYGYAGGYNHALKHVQADYYVLLNNDIEVPEHWIEPVIDVMEQDKQVAACQPKMLDYKDKSLFEYAGACGGYIDSLGYVFCRGRLFESLEADHHQYDSEEYIFWATGACMFVRANVFHEMGGFDEHFFAHMEEVDLCWRMQLAGHTIKVVPKSFVYHVGGGTLNKMSAHKTYLNFRNNLIMITKNMPVRKLLWLLPFRSVLDLVSSVFFLVNGFPKYSGAVHRAHAHYFFQFAKWWKLRRQVNPLIKTREYKGVYKGSIVREHFINGKKFFSDITFKNTHNQ